MNKLKILAYPSPGGSRQYRLDQIAKYINRSGEAVMVVSPIEMRDQDLDEADIIIMEGTIDPRSIATVWAYSAEMGKVFIAECDDWVEVTDKTHPFYKEHKELKATKWQSALIAKADAVTTTTDFLAKELRNFNGNVKVLPNCLDMDLWGTPKLENTDDEVRIVWAGSATHREDMAMIKPVVFRILEKYPNARFIYCGDGKLWENKLFEDHPQTEFVQPTSLDQWPMKFKTLRADIGLIPLLDNHFNHCKSNLKWLENAAYSIPCVMSPTVYSEYVIDGVDGYIAKNEDEFVEKLSKLIENKEIRKTIGMNANTRLLNEYDISKNWRQWLDFYKEQYQLKQK